MYKTWTIAKFEMRTLLRGWFFRIFAGLMVLGIGIFSLAVNLVESGAPWIYRALPASVPYANLIILNLGQAIVAIFLASEFLKQDKKNDTVEVIYARSMSNTQYILGKSIGILLVFFVLNVIILALGVGFSFISNDGGQNILSYLYYPILISLPTLVFVLGLSFFLMITLKNQAITFILLLGYIALSIFYLNHKFYHLADFIAYNVPMIHSTIGGFGNIQETLMHRGIFLFFGIGLIFFTITQIDRLPESNRFKALPILLTVLFLSLGGIISFKYIRLKESVIEFKKEMLVLNDQNVSLAKVYVNQCDIELEHLSDKISAKANLIVENKTQTSIETFIFSLNPSLDLLSVEIEGKKVDFSRKLHIIRIKNSRSLKPGEKLNISFRYSGKINENTSFIDIDLENYEDNFSLEIFRLRKRFAYLQSDFVCLTSESLWYPISGTTYAPSRPAVYLPDFTQFSLKVKTTSKLTPVSQGKITKLSKTETQFLPEFPLPKLSLLIADYVNYSIKVDSIEYNLYTRKGNDYYMNHFKEIKDSIPQIIKDLREEYETFVGMKYPFKRFALAEVPVEFALDKHVWSIASDAVQPEMIFYSEKAVVMEETDFRKRKKRETDRMKDENEEVLPAELQARMLKRCIRCNLMAKPSEWYNFDKVVDRNTYTLFPQFYTFLTQVKSDEFPIINMALEAYLREQNVETEAGFRWFRDGVSPEEKINLELKNSSLKELVMRGITVREEESDDRDNRPISLNQILLAKGVHLFSLFRSRYGEKEFNSLIFNILNSNLHQSFEFDLISNAIQTQFNDTITKDIEKWYNTKELPGFLVKEIENYKVLEGEYSKYQVRFKISNAEAVDGLVTLSIEMAEDNKRRNQDWDALSNTGFTKKIFIPAHSAKEVGFVFTSEPARMSISTHISENLPNNQVFDFTSFDEVKNTKPFDSIANYTFFETINEKNEIIVDNEDTNFHFVQKSNSSYLKTLINEGKKDKYPYSRIRFWNPPNQWNAVLRSGFYGKYVRSAIYTKTGKGDRIATWNAPIKEAALYDVYCNIERIDMEWQENERLNYQFKIYHTEGVEVVSLEDTDIETGWNYLGTFYFSSAKAKVELTNKSTGEMIFADAIKWVKAR